MKITTIAAGALLGMVAGGVVLLVAPIAPLAAGLLAVGVLAGITGALHIDGLPFSNAQA